MVTVPFFNYSGKDQERQVMYYRSTLMFRFIRIHCTDVLMLMEYVQKLLKMLLATVNT